MSETWAVVDDEGAAHEVAVDEGRGSTRSWWAATQDVARRSHVGPRDAVVLVAQACGWPIAEVLSPGTETRAAEVAHLEGRRGALLAEVDRLTAALDAVGHALGAESRERGVLLAAIEEARRAAWYDGVREMRGAAGIHAMRHHANHDDALAIFDLPPPIPAAIPGAARCGCDACGKEVSQ